MVIYTSVGREDGISHGRKFTSLMGFFVCVPSCRPIQAGAQKHSQHLYS